MVIRVWADVVDQGPRAKKIQFDKSNNFRSIVLHSNAS